MTVELEVEGHVMTRVALRKRRATHMARRDCVQTVCVVKQTLHLETEYIHRNIKAQKSNESVFISVCLIS